MPKEVGYEDAMSASQVKAIWNNIYARIKPGMNEQEQRAVRIAFYVYAAKNGTSRVGSYSAKIVLSNGTEIDAAILPQATGPMGIRKFFRGNMDEAYVALKDSKAMERDPRFVAKVSDLNIGAEAAFATGDWFTNCALFTPAEKQAHQKSFDASVERARRTRNGHTLESVEHQRNQRSLEVQGPMHGEEVTL